MDEISRSIATAPLRSSLWAGDIVGPRTWTQILMAISGNKTRAGAFIKMLEAPVRASHSDPSQSDRMEATYGPDSRPHIGPHSKP